MNWKFFSAKARGLLSEKRVLSGVTIALFLAALIVGMIAVGMLGDKNNERDAGTQQNNASTIDILNLPPENASEEERVAHFERVQAAAAVADVWAIQEGCTASPSVIKKGEQEQSFKVKNEDSQEHVIGFSSEYEFKIGVGETKTVSIADFYQGPGLYSFACDRGKVFGMVFVVENPA